MTIMLTGHWAVETVVVEGVIASALNPGCVSVSM